MKKTQVHYLYYYEVSYGKLFIGEISEFSKDGLNTFTTYTNVDSTPNYTSFYKYDSGGKMTNQMLTVYQGKDVMMEMEIKGYYNEQGDELIDSTYSSDTLSSVKKYVNEYKNSKLTKQTDTSEPPDYMKKNITEYDDNGNVCLSTTIDANDNVYSQTRYYYSGKDHLDSLFSFINDVYERHLSNHDTTIVYTEASADTIKRFDRKTIYAHNEKKQLVKETVYFLKTNKPFYEVKYSYNNKGLLIHYKMEKTDGSSGYEVKYRYVYY